MNIFFFFFFFKYQTKSEKLLLFNVGQILCAVNTADSGFTFSVKELSHRQQTQKNQTARDLVNVLIVLCITDTLGEAEDRFNSKKSYAFLDNFQMSPLRGTYNS